ncbi:MAG: YbjN domain-containing protein [Chloroflexi bacterium]|nr:YbjN domain-containing protein [Chloroflexota bacterium]
MLNARLPAATRVRYDSPAALTDKQLAQILTADGWPFERLGDTTWRSWFTVEELQHRFRFFARLNRSWLFLTIIPYVVLPADPAAHLAIYRHLLELNRTVTLAKFALDKNDVVLTVELPTEHLVDSQVKDGLDALSYYAGLHYAEISELVAPRGAG